MEAIEIDFTGYHTADFQGPFEGKYGSIEFDYEYTEDYSWAIDERNGYWDRKVKITDFNLNVDIDSEPITRSEREEIKEALEEALLEELKD